MCGISISGGVAAQAAATWRHARDVKRRDYTSRCEDEHPDRAWFECHTSECLSVKACVGNSTAVQRSLGDGTYLWRDQDVERAASVVSPDDEQVAPTM